MLKLSVVLFVSFCFCGCTRGQSPEQNAKAVALVNQTDSMGAAASLLSKQIGAILTNPGNDSTKAWYLLDSLGHLRDTKIEDGQSAMRGVLKELSKDTESRLFPLYADNARLTMFYADNVRLTIRNLDLQKRQDSLFHLCLLDQEELQKNGGVKTDSWQVKVLAEDSCMEYLNLEMGWTKQAGIDIVDSMGLSGIAQYSERDQLRKGLISGYVKETNSRSAALGKVWSPIIDLKNQDKKSIREIKQLDSLSVCAEAIFVEMEFPFGRLLAELSRDTTDVAYASGLHFWSLVKKQSTILRQMNALILSFCALAKEGMGNKSNQDSSQPKMVLLDEPWGSLYSELQSMGPDYQAAKEDYIAHKTW
ncbi:MAG TPA: hypothetical protein VGM92_11380 [Candidatus Kapabacteria bacterium]